MFMMEIIGGFGNNNGKNGGSGYYGGSGGHSNGRYDSHHDGGSNYHFDCDNLTGCGWKK